MLKVDYSELVEALQQGNNAAADELLKEIMPRLEEYLQVVMNASPADARECVQQACMDVLDKIRKNKILEKKTIFSYLITAARNQYLSYSQYQHRFTADPDDVYHQVEPAKQIEALIESERMKILEQCLSQLDELNQKFMRFFMENPDSSTKEASKKFNLSNAYVRTKKSRLINNLHHCFKRKSSRF